MVATDPSEKPLTIVQASRAGEAAEVRRQA